jgi:hypothetical protein
MKTKEDTAVVAYCPIQETSIVAIQPSRHGRPAGRDGIPAYFSSVDTFAGGTIKHLSRTLHLTVSTIAAFVLAFTSLWKLNPILLPIAAKLGRFMPFQ